MKSLPLVLALVACGGGAGGGGGGGTTPGGPGSAGKPAAAGDVSFDVPTIPIAGVIFEPEALGRPGMPLYQPKNKKLTLDQQRKIFQTTTPIVDKQAQAAVLATMLYDESKKQTGNAAKALITEAQKALRDVALIAKAQVDDVTLRLLGSYEIQLDDWPAAEKAWEQLTVRLAKAKTGGPEARAWWCYSLLKQYKNTEALAAISGQTPSQSEPELAYAMAWAKWRAGDDAGAWAAIVAAGAGWGTSANKNILERDVLLFAGRSSTPFDKVTVKLFAVFNAKQPAQQYEVLAKLGLEAYQFAGRWNEGVAALELALKTAGSTVPPNDNVAIHYHLSDFLLRLDQPDASARNARAALDALPACPKCSAKEKQEIVVEIYNVGRLFHLLYATANDVRYYQPALDLYTATLGLIMDPAIRNQARDYKDTLEKTLKNTKAGTGTHEKQAIGALLQRHNQEIQACYEAVLAANPKLGGTLVLNLESDATGAMKGASSEPKAGVAELSAVAGCSVAHAREWKLPKRGMAGNTRIKLTYTLSRKP